MAGRKKLRKLTRTSPGFRVGELLNATDRRGIPNDPVKRLGLEIVVARATRERFTASPPDSEFLVRSCRDGRALPSKIFDIFRRLGATEYAP